MTEIRFHQRLAPRPGGAQLLVLALLVGAVIGASMTFVLVTQSRTGALVAAPGGVSAVVAAPIATHASTTAGQQYLAWYTRPSGPRAVQTTAGQQYLDWYTRPSDTGRWEAASRQYASWYLRDADGR